jgi:hypothetical protein
MQSKIINSKIKSETLAIEKYYRTRKKNSIRKRQMITRERLLPTSFSKILPGSLTAVYLGIKQSKKSVKKDR